MLPMPSRLLLSTGTLPIKSSILRSPVTTAVPSSAPDEHANCVAAIPQDTNSALSPQFLFMTLLRAPVAEYPPSPAHVLTCVAKSEPLRVHALRSVFRPPSAQRVCHAVPNSETGYRACHAGRI